MTTALKIKLLVLWQRFKIPFVALAVLILVYLARAFGQSNKKEHYLEVVNDFQQGKRQQFQDTIDSLQEQVYTEKLESIDSLEKEKQAIDKALLLQELERRKERGCFPEPSTKDAIKRLEDLGY
jgi:hypothetical protein